MRSEVLGVTVLWPGRRIPMAPDAVVHMNEHLEEDPDVDFLHGATMDYARRLDLRYLEDHPDATS
jgi:hypothetical protein